MNIKSIILGSLFAVVGACNAAEGVLKIVTDRIGRPDEVLELGLKERQDRLDLLSKERAQLEAARPQFSAEIQLKTSDIEKKLSTIRDALKLDPDNDFLLKTQSLLNDWFQVLKEQQKIQDDIVIYIQERITQLTEYLKDPDFKGYEREQKAAGIAGRSFEYVQGLNQKIIELKKTVDSLTSQEKDALTEYDNKKRYLSGVKETHKKKKEELASMHLRHDESDAFGLSVRQKGELLILEEKFYRDKTALEEMRLRAIENKRAALSMSIIMAKAKLDIIKNILAKEKLSIKVTELDIFVARDDLAKRKQLIDAEIASLQREIDQFDTKDTVLQEISKRYAIRLGSDLDDWKVEAGKGVDGYVALFEVGLVNDQSLLAKREKDLLETRKSLEQEQFAQEAVQVDIQESYYRITSRKFRSETDIAAEIKKYTSMRDDAEAKNSECVSKRRAFVILGDAQRKALESLHNRERDLRRLKETTFKNNPTAYARVLDLMHSVQILVKRQIKVIDEIGSIYDDITAKINAKILQFNFIIDELENIKWYRSEYAITFKDVRNIGTDVNRFIKDVYAYLTNVHAKAFVMTIVSVFDTPFSWFLLLIKLLVMIAFLIMLRIYVPAIVQVFVNAGKSYRGLRTLSLLFACLGSFFVRYFTYIVPWLLIYVIGQLYVMPDPYIYVLFYLVSIPYCIFLAYCFVRYLVEFNEKNNYVLISQEFQPRFAITFSVLLYATIGIFLFREAFLMINYLKSELPTILLALNVILLQISLIFMLGKEQILHMIPTQNVFGEWVYKQVDTYYNLILFAVVTLIVLSNPYVGFGRYIVRILTRIVATVLLAKALILIHSFLKRTSASFFFSIKEDTVKERFSYAKTWYGVFVIATMITLIVFALVIGAKLWHWPEALVKINKWEDIRSWLTMPLLMERSEHPISIFSIFQIIASILSGLFIAFVFDRFLLHRIFDVLLVDHGVQNAVSSLTRYCIIIIAFILGIQSVGLGAQVSYFLAALLLGVGWVIKDPAYDFISYFIILIQRPVKIGDYIRFDEDVRGVVRRITPRAVILRRRNSATIIVPNSQVMSKSFSNWNYGRGFIAFDDIYITVEYSEDPQKVKTILNEVLVTSPYILKSPAPIVRLYRFGAYGFIFQIRGFMSSSYTLDMWDIAGDVRMALALALRKSNIKISSVKMADGMIGTMGGQNSVAEFPDHRQSDE